ncbi:MAG: hypothetical protein HY400_01585 [Elusimicrobia bacterium]|nr:hypothetical protein [Elusimicrobiota bacterium]
MHILIHSLLLTLCLAQTQNRNIQTPASVEAVVAPRAVVPSMFNITMQDWLTIAHPGTANPLTTPSIPVSRLLPSSQKIPSHTPQKAPLVSIQKRQAFLKSLESTEKFLYQKQGAYLLHQLSKDRKFWDGASLLFQSAGESPSYAPQEELPEKQQADLKLYFKKDKLIALQNSQISASINLVKETEGSRWWWGLFKRGKRIRIMAGFSPLFETQITSAVTKPIRQLTKKDLRETGLFQDRQIELHPIERLRRAVLQHLISKQGENTTFKLTLGSKVRVTRFKTWEEMRKESGELPEPPPTHDPYAPRRDLNLDRFPKLKDLNLLLPKVILLDDALLPEKLPPEILEDMGKLQRIGVQFVLLSQRNDTKKHSVENQMMDGMYEFLSVTDGGGKIVARERAAPPKQLYLNPFTELELKTLHFISEKTAADLEIPANQIKDVSQQGMSSIRYQLHLPKGTDTQKWMGTFLKYLKLYNIAYDVMSGETQEGTPYILTQKTNLKESMPELLSALQKVGVYANPQDILVLSENKDILPSLVPATQTILRKDMGNPSADISSLQDPIDFSHLVGGEFSGLDLVEAALAAILGPYRQNMPGDMVSSASAMSEFKDRKKAFFERELIRGEENIYAFWGHMTHQTMNWIAWRMRNGSIPTLEQAKEKLRRMWRDHVWENAVHVPSGDSDESYLRAAEARLTNIYGQFIERMSDGTVHFAMVAKVPQADGTTHAVHFDTEHNYLDIASRFPNHEVTIQFFSQAHPEAELDAASIQKAIETSKMRFLGTELPNFFMLTSENKKTGKTTRFFIRTIFDFVALRETTPGHAEVWVMDFKSGVKPTQQKMDADIQVRTYKTFALRKWNQIPPSFTLADGQKLEIDTVITYFIYSPRGLKDSLNNLQLGLFEKAAKRIITRLYQETLKAHQILPNIPPKSSKSKKKRY